MPREETIQLSKIKGILGSKDDLPISSTRSSVISKLKSLLLRISGVSNITNSFGTAESSESLSLTVTPGSMKTDGNYMYILAESGTTAKIDKIDLSTFTVHSTLDISASLTNLYACEIVGRHLYAVTYTSPAKVAKVDLDSFTLDSSLTLSLNSAVSVISDGTDLYVGHETSPTRITKISLDDFTETTTLNTLVGEGTYSLQIDNTYLYVVQISNPAKVTRIKLSSFTVDSTLTLTAGAWGVTSFVYGNYLYVSVYTGKIYKVDLNTFTIITSLTTTTNYANGSALGIDGTYLISAGVPSTASPSVTYVDLATFTEYGIHTLPANNNIFSFALDSTFFYFGLANNTVYRKYIQPTTQVDSRTLNNLNVNIDTLDSRLTETRAGYITDLYELLHSGTHYMYPANAAGVTITSAAGAYTKGAYAEVIPVNTILTQYYITGIIVYNLTVNTDYVFDIATGLAGAEVIIATVSHITDNTNLGHECPFPVPIKVSSSTRISIRSSDSAGSKTSKVKIRYKI